MNAMPSEPQGYPDLREPDGLTLSEIALDLHEADSPGETVERILEYSREALGSDEAGVLLIRARSRLDVVASTHPDVTRAHLLQVELGEGPCLDAAVDPTAMFRVDDTKTDPSYPRWNAEVAAMGFRSILAAPLATQTRRYGSLNLYARRPDAFDEDDEAVAMILARHASVALAASHNIEGLRSAIDARKMIGMAMGILMARYELEADPAFDVLRRYSQTRNLKLRAVAERVVAVRGLPSDW